jgi:hypothetical protein
LGWGLERERERERGGSAMMTMAWSRYVLGDVPMAIQAQRFFNPTLTLSSFVLKDEIVIIKWELKCGNCHPL